MLREFTVRSKLLITLSAPLLAVAVGASAESVDELLASASTAVEVEAFAGVPVTRCVAAPSAMSLCEWQLGNRAAGWKAVTMAIDTDDRVALLCLLPDDGSARTPGSCTAAPMVSNRSRWGVTSRARRKGAKLPKEQFASPASKRVAAQREIDAARTLIEISRMLGATPVGCTPGLPGSQVCLWKGTARVHGHGTLAASIGTSMSKKVIMRCSLPLDGSPRNPGSCRVQIGT
jgi:hypothetical protein